MTTPDQPLPADATDEQVRQRQYWIPVDGDETDVLIAVARELQAATQAEYEAKLAALEADKERLDWLEDVNHVYAVFVQVQPHGDHVVNGCGPILRAAIDAARTPSPETPNDR